MRQGHGGCLAARSGQQHSCLEPGSAAEYQGNLQDATCRADQVLSRIYVVLPTSTISCFPALSAAAYMQLCCVSSLLPVSRYFRNSSLYLIHGNIIGIYSQQTAAEDLDTSHRVSSTNCDIICPCSVFSVHIHSGGSWMRQLLS